MDCLEAMKQMPDNAFDLAVVDPPYGDGSQVVQVEREREKHTERGTASGNDLTATNTRLARVNRGGGGTGRTNTTSVHYQRKNCRQADGTWGYANWRRVEQQVRSDKKIIAWDVAPGAEYFEELFRVSRNQIIWGGNYFPLPPTRCFLVWRKLTISEAFSMAMAEYAWTSFNGNAKVFEFPPQGKPGDRFHPTQKPIELYAWIYNLYAKPGMKILDTHLGSGSSRIAAYNAGLDFVGYEIDKTYFDLQEERFAKHTQQTSLFIDYEQEDIFTQEEL